MRNSSTVRILHLSRLVGSSSFGIGSVVLGLAQGQQAAGCHVEMWSQDPPSELRELEDSYTIHPNTLHSFPHVDLLRSGFSPWMERKIIARTQDFDIIHQHGIWTAVSRVTNKWHARTSKPTVIAPHGSLDAWALRRSAWKKRIALALYERENLRQASCLHALSRREAEGFRAFGLKNPITIIPNGISVTWLDRKGDPDAFRCRFGLSKGTRILLFLGRITPIKGLPMLIEAMHKLRAKLAGWKLIIVGANEFGHEQEIRSLIDRLEMEDHVQFVGPLFGQAKRDAFAAADLFVLPSHSEGAPVVILEALGAGVPVLTTNASPWEELVTYRCGWWTDISAEAISDALEDALRRSKAELREMGQRGRRLVSEKYTWSQIAEQTLVLYEWLLHGCRVPDFVITE